MPSLTTQSRGQGLQRNRAQLLASLLAVGLALAVGWARHQGWLAEVAVNIQDRCTRVAYQQQGFPSDCPVLLVSIDERSLAELRLPYALWRPQIAEVVSSLRKAEARVVALDVLFGLRPETFAAYGSEFAPLQRSLQAAEGSLASEIFEGPIVVATHLNQAAILDESCPPLTGAAGDRLGWVNLDQDSDGAVRHFDLFEPVRRQLGEEATWMPSLATRVATLASGQSIDPSQPLWQGRPLPQEDGLVRINYKGPSGHIPRISFVDVLAGRELNRVKGKVVLLGLTDPRFGDHHRSPFSVHGEPDMAGVEIQAFAAWTLLSGNFVRVAPPWLNLLFIVAAGVLAGRIAWHAPVRGMVLLGIAFPPFWLCICALAYLSNRVLLDGVGPIASLLLVALGVYAWRAATVEGRRRELQATFGRMVSPQVMRSLERDPDLAWRREHREVTVLFTDINNFTPACEASTPEQIMDALGDYFTGMVEIIHRHDGTIKQYVGDEIMVIFGAPHDQPDHAARAVQTALDMQKLLAEKQATTYAFDRLNRNTALTYPGGDGETFQFDANSNLVAWNRGSYTVQYTFDDLDRLSRLDSPTTNDHIVLNYDQLDRVETMTDNSGTTTYGYTNNYLLDRVTRQTGKISYGYDDADRLTTMTADGDVTQYSYDDRDRLVQATLDGQSVHYAFDQADRPTLMSFSNGVSCQQVFNERDGLLSKRYLRGGSPLFSVKYAYNQLGQRKLEEKKTSNWTKSTRYAYNKRRELSNSYRKVNRGCTIETSYGYDLNHNRIKKDETRYRSNANDQLTTVQRPSQTLAYNTAGQAVTADSSTYTYSYSDQIKTVNTGATQASYVYDGNGQRVQKTVDGVISKFLWAGSEIVKEYTGSGDVKAQYFLGGGRTAIKHNGKWNFYLTDGLGSTVMLADHRGRSVATWDYSDFGETTQLTGGTSVYNPFLYTGQELDKETGFYHLRARHYAPSLGKFLSRDPIGYASGSNLYSYTSDPINFTDPSGLQPVPSPSPGPSPAPGPPAPGPGAPGSGPPNGGSPLGILIIGGTVTAVGTGLGALGTATGAAVASGNHAFSNLINYTVGPYSHIPTGNFKIEAGREFSPAQKLLIIEANMKRNGGVVMSDDPRDPYYGKPLKKPVKNMSKKLGYPSPCPDEWQVDHYDPADGGGSNSFANARVVSRKWNRTKSNLAPEPNYLYPNSLIPPPFSPFPSQRWTNDQ